MKTLRKTIILAFLSFLILSSANLVHQNGFVVEAQGTLDYNEATHLAFMREEEKLARDVYITLGKFYPWVKTFSNIDDSEQRHTDSVLKVMNSYGLSDPNTNDEVGAFTGEEWGWYFTEKYEQLVLRGSQGVLNALYVGAFIEELDMHDIIYCPQVIVDTDNGINESNQCGRVYTDEKPILRLYQNLLDGSVNHLKAYVYGIEQIIGEGKYEAQYLTQEEVDDILGR
ncbi:MAG: DUF2202 domain-containing protein [Chromatiales bacterium]